MYVCTEDVMAYIHHHVNTQRTSSDLAPEPLCLCQDLHGPTPQDRPVALLTISLGNLDLLVIWVHLFKMLHLSVAEQDTWILKSLILFLHNLLADGLRVL